ncbi:MAG TPA: phage portal protein [Anaerolineae bacterium]|nr:phage portal protein [Anaerolineae bacterium]
MASDLERAYEALAAKRSAYDELWAYYDGDQPLVYSAVRLREIFRNVDAKFRQNWCGVVVDSILERLNLTGFTLLSEAKADEANGPDVPTPGNAALADLWARQGLALDAADIHTATAVIGEAFLIIWPNEAGEPEAYHNPPQQCAAFYDADNPRRMSFAAKWWVGTDGRLHLTLYYADRLEYYVSGGKAENTTSAQGLAPDDPDSAPNPYGEIPVFHFRRERRLIKGELEPSVIDTQNAVNKLFSDLMVAAEFGAFKQRWVISQSDVSGQLRNAPNEIWSVPAGDGAGQATQIGEFSEQNLASYLNAMDSLASALAKIKRLPKHFFYSQGGDPSGEALIAMEAPLNKKCKTYIERLSSTWQRAVAFMLKLQGMAVSPQDIQVNYDDPRTTQPESEARTRQANAAAGMPLRTQLRQAGWTPQELAQMDADAQEEAKARQTMMAVGLMEQQRFFDQGQGSAGPES